MALNKTTKVMALAFTMFAMTGMLGFTGNPAFAEPGKGGASEGPKGVGKGGFQLNLIAHNVSDIDCTDKKGHKIFIPLNGKFKILLTEGPFEVIDCNANDATGPNQAKFQLPDPLDLDDDGEIDDGLGCDGFTCLVGYQVWIRVLGQPNKEIDILPTCAIDQFDEKFCSKDGILTVESANGAGKKAKFTNVTKQLLTLCIDFDKDGVCDERITLFDDRFVEYLWEFDNKGARHAQLRFIIETFEVS